MYRAVRTLVVGASVALAACGGSTDVPSGPTPSLVISPSATTVEAGGTPVTFSATLAGGSGTIGWSLSGPGTLSATSGASTVYTPPPTAASATTATITASAAGQSQHAAITISPAAAHTVTVSGRVVDECGNGVADAAVWISGKGTILSGAGGAFSVSNVQTPYDAGVITPGSPDLVIIVAGLTRSDPVLVSTAPPKLHSARISGSVSGAMGGAFITQVDFASSPGAPAIAGGSDPLTAPGGSFDITYQWCAPATISGTLHLLDAETGNTDAPVYHAYVEVPSLSMADGGAVSTPATLVPGVATSTMSGSVTVPSGFQLTTKVLRVTFSDDDPGMPVSTLFGATAQSPTFSFTTPVLSDASLALQVSATDATGRTVSVSARGIPVNATGVSLVLPPSAPGLARPTDGATAVDLGAQDFSWTASFSSLHLLELASSSLVIAIVTPAAHVTIPSLADLGVGVPPAGTEFTWVVGTLDGFATPDDVAATSTGPFARASLVRPSRQGISESRTFTTK